MKLKLSWSILSAWSRGDQDRAIKMIMGAKTDTNIYMEEGKRIHDIIAKNQLPLIPLVKKTAVFEDYETGLNCWTNRNDNTIKVFDWLEMSMIADVLDVEEGLLIDWKTGSQPSMAQNKMQIYVYAYLLSILPEPIRIKHGVIAKVEEMADKTIKCTDYSVYLITDEKLELGENYIESNASEIYNFFQESKGNQESKIKQSETHEKSKVPF